MLVDELHFCNPFLVSFTAHGALHEKDGIYHLLIRSDGHLHINGAASGAIWGSVSCSRTLRHVACMGWGSNYQLADQRMIALLPKLQLPLLVKYHRSHFQFYF